MFEDCDGLMMRMADSDSFIFLFGDRIGVHVFSAAWGGKRYRTNARRELPAVQPRVSEGSGLAQIVAERMPEKIRSTQAVRGENRSGGASPFPRTG